MKRGLLWICACLLPFTVLSCASLKKAGKTLQNIGAEVSYPINHAAEKSDDLSPVSIEHNQMLDIEIQGTNQDCYFYNSRTEEVEQIDAQGRRSLLPPRDKTTVHLKLHHDESVVAYVVVITRKEPDTCKSDPLGPRTYRIPVRSLWNVVGAGGFIGHDLVKAEYFLEPKDNGFIVRRQAEHEDDQTIGSAAMIHIYRSGRGLFGVSFAPLTFGLNVDQNRSDYLVGTSLRFGHRAYLTVGRIFGTVNRLPNGLTIDGFTTNANALANMGTRRESAWFVGASFGFLSAGVSNLFKTKVGIPQVQGGTGNQPAAPTAEAFAMTVAPTEGAQGDPVKLTAPPPKTFPPAADDVRLDLTSAGATIQIPSKNLGTEWKEQTINFDVPGGAKLGDATIELVASGKKVATAKFLVQAKLTASPERGATTAEVTLKQVTGVEFGNRGVEGSKVLLKQGGRSLELKSDDAAVTWATNEIKFKPEGFSAGLVEITVFAGGRKVARSKYTVE